MECYDRSTKNPVHDCGEKRKYYDSSSVLCFTEIAIGLSTSEELPHPTAESPYYSEIPCIGSRSLERRGGFAGVIAPWILKEESASGRFIISNDSFEEEFQWWFDPTLWAPKNQPNWVWQIDVTVDSIKRTTYFPIVPARELSGS